MSDAYKCDRCNDIIEETLPEMRAERAEWGCNWRAELCPSCAESFKTWLRNGGGA